MYYSTTEPVKCVPCEQCRCNWRLPSHYHVRLTCGIDWCCVSAHVYVCVCCCLPYVQHIRYCCPCLLVTLVSLTSSSSVCCSKRTSGDSGTSKEKFLHVPISCCEAERREGAKLFSYSLPNQVCHSGRNVNAKYVYVTVFANMYVYMPSLWCRFTVCMYTCTLPQ